MGSQEVEGEVLGDDFKGYIFRITGGNDKQGFPMVQGVLLAKRCRLLLAKGSKCYKPRKVGERKRKSVRGCIVSHDLAVLNLVVVKKGDADVEGLTDEGSAQPRRLGPKRASKIKKLFNLGKKGDARIGAAHLRRTINAEDAKKKYSKAPKIQRLITPERLARKRKWSKLKEKRYTKSQDAAKKYNILAAKRLKEKQDALKAEKEKKRQRSEKKRRASERKRSERAASQKGE